MGCRRIVYGVMAVLLAFVFPFLVLIFSLFAFMAMWHDELVSALCSLGLLIPLLLYIVAEQVAIGKRSSLSQLKPMN